MDACALPGAQGPFYLSPRLRRTLHALARGCPNCRTDLARAMSCSPSAAGSYVRVLQQYGLVQCHGTDNGKLTAKGLKWLSRNPLGPNEIICWPSTPVAPSQPPTRLQALELAHMEAREALDAAGIPEGSVTKTLAARIRCLAAARDCAVQRMQVDAQARDATRAAHAALAVFLRP